MAPQVIVADYSNPTHAEQIVHLLDLYARDPMGGGKPLPETVKRGVVGGLADTGNAFSLLAYLSGEPVGLANCFEGFSTFNCKPLINIHDVVVSMECRGEGIGRALLQKAEQLALQKGCCKLTLEVLEGNRPAKHLYRSFGFENYCLAPGTGAAEFWQKALVGNP